MANDHIMTTKAMHAESSVPLDRYLRFTLGGVPTFSLLATTYVFKAKSRHYLRFVLTTYVFYGKDGTQ